MTYSVAEAPPFADNVISPFSLNSIGAMALGGFTSLATFNSSVWPTANKAAYIPFVLQAPATLYQVGWHNGGTAAGTSEAGVYDAGGTKIISGAAAQTGTSVVQWVNVTDTLLQPGQYWMALTNTLATGTYFNSAPTAPLCAALGILTQVTANPLPATATFALDQTWATIPLVFLQMRSTM